MCFKELVISILNTKEPEQKLLDYIQKAKNETCFEFLMCVLNELERIEKKESVFQLKKIVGFYIVIFMSYPESFGEYSKEKERKQFYKFIVDMLPNSEKKCKKLIKLLFLSDLKQELKEVYQGLGLFLEKDLLIEVNNIRKVISMFYILINDIETCNLIMKECFFRVSENLFFTEKQTILGAILSNGPFSPRNRCFMIEKLVNRNNNNKFIHSEIEHAIKSMRSMCRANNEEMFQILNESVRGKEREGFRMGLLKYFSEVGKINKERSKMNPNRLKISSDNFILNILYILLNFCEPIYSESRYERIEIEFFTEAETIPEDLTRIKKTQKEFEEHRREPRMFGFITEVFFLTSWFLHIGLFLIIRTHYSLIEQIRELKLELEENEEKNKEKEILLDRLNIAFFSYEVLLRDEEFLLSVCNFYTTMMEWLLFQKKKKHSCFGYIPEYIFIDIDSFFEYITERRIDINLSWQKKICLEFVSVFLGRSDLINPPTRVILATLLYRLVLSDKEVLHNIEKEADEIVKPLLIFYVEVENKHTSQFYDNFSIRYKILSILEECWKIKRYKEAVCKQGKERLFVLFVNMLICDVTYFLDETLLLLLKIKEDENKKEVDGDVYRENEEKCQNYILFAEKSIKTLYNISAEIRKPFLIPEIVHRLAEMLNKNIVKLTEPRCSKLKIKNPEKIGFNPKELLLHLFLICIGLSNEDVFAKAICMDDAYEEKSFLRAIDILCKHNICDSLLIEQIRLFIAKTESFKEEELFSKQLLEDAPEEFIDPLLSTLMLDPVILPTSNVTLDRRTIIAHLLNEKRDPFNRKDLTDEMLVPNVELKKRIKEFIESKKKAKESKPLHGRGG